MYCVFSVFILRQSQLRISNEIFRDFIRKNLRNVTVVAGVVISSYKLAMSFMFG